MSPRRQTTSRKAGRAARAQASGKGLLGTDGGVDAFLKWFHAGMIRFGSMLEDLECYVDNSVVWSEEEGRIVGRRGGIRQWLRENASDLSERYKTVMKYKALAKKFRQAVRVSVWRSSPVALIFFSRSFRPRSLAMGMRFSCRYIARLSASSL